LRHAYAHVQLGLAVGQFSVGLGLVGFALGLEDGGLGLDLGDFLLGVAALPGLADFASHAGFRDVDARLVRGALVRFAREESEVF
jgi:hypothetical protein